MKLLIIIPAYNEEANIGKVVENIKMNYPQYDYIVVNDGSRDMTSGICHENGYDILSLPINLGLAVAFQTGIRYAWLNDYDCVVQLDADGQHLPNYIGPMLEELQKGNDIVIGSRFLMKAKPKSLRMLGSIMISRAIRLTTGVKLTDPTSGMRMFNHNMIREFAENINYGPEPDTISFLLKQGVKISETAVEMHERLGGKSYFNAVKSIEYMFHMLLSILVVQNFRVRY